MAARVVVGGCRCDQRQSRHDVNGVCCNCVLDTKKKKKDFQLFWTQFSCVLLFLMQMKESARQLAPTTAKTGDSNSSRTVWTAIDLPSREAVGCKVIHSSSNAQHSQSRKNSTWPWAAQHEWCAQFNAARRCCCGSAGGLRSRSCFRNEGGT
eukprot:m.164875 g.164875  ORF g.164875 m.164875 type:complete len:152 (-) comp21067_c2_seq18:67-522(-)